MPLVRGRAPTSRPTLAPSKALVGVVEHVDAVEQLERAVLELQGGALGGLDGLRDLEQAQPDRGVLPQQLAGGDTEEQRVADLSGGSGDDDVDGRDHCVYSRRSNELIVGGA